MLPFISTFGAWALATVLPALVGFALVYTAGRTLAPRYTSAFGLGIFLWFFVDTIQGSSNLLVNEGFTGGAGQAAVVLLFVAGLLALSLLDRDLFAYSPDNEMLPRFVPFLVALAIGVHGLGEGLAAGYTAASAPGTDLLAVFGGVGQGAAYILHKTLEPMMAGAVYVALTRKEPKPLSRVALDLASLTVVFALPSLLGETVGYYVATDVTYAYGLGAGTAVYAALRLGRETFRPAEAPSSHTPLKVAAALLVGFLLIYLAALLHY